MCCNNIEKKIIIASDFDGTITTKDTLIEFIRHTHGSYGLFCQMLRVLPWIILMFLKLYPNHKAKQRLLRNCYGGMTRQQLDTYAASFAEVHRHLLKPDMMQMLTQAAEKKAEVIVVTASVDIWVEKFLPDVRLAATQLQFSDNRFTGVFLTPNCYGEEKVNRLCQEYPELRTNREKYYVIAYGDSAGDHALLQFADEPHKVKTER